MPPISCTTSPTYGLNTRKTARSPTTQEEIEALPNKVKDAISRKTFLESKLLCHIGQPFTITQMSSSTPVLVVTAIRAVVYLLKNIEINNITEAITKQVAHSLITELADINMADTISKKVTDKSLPN
ncbi:hypothetical protein DFH29DRAFT_881499 [Suillus ampliporus]|nr:hypothetical protein DFH29DRAFT_881499 [Suillus ampliporus]